MAVDSNQTNPIYAKHISRESRRYRLLEAGHLSWTFIKIINLKNCRFYINLVSITLAKIQPYKEFRIKTSIEAFILKKTPQIPLNLFEIINKMERNFYFLEDKINIWVLV